MNHTESGTRQKWRERVERQRSSGLSVAGFCARHGIAACSLYAWRKRLVATPTFVEAKIVEASGTRSAGMIEVRLRGGRRVLVRCAGFDRALLQEVVAALESLPHGVEASL
jgi:hypothetical protein